MDKIKNYYSIYVEGVENSFFTYSSFERYRKGEWVIVKFGKKEKSGLVIGEEEERDFKFEIKEILSKAESMLPISETLVELFLWIKNYYAAQFGDILSNGYPANMKIGEKVRCHFMQPFIPVHEEEQEFLEYISKKESAARSTLDQKFGREKIAAYIKRGIIQETKEIDDSASRKRESGRGVRKGVKKEVNLSKEQIEIRDEIIASTKKYFLIRGVTGSGKTEIYIEISREALKNGEGVIFLVPEISLTPQMIERFCGEFENDIAVLHSRMTPKEREDEWKRIWSGEKKVVLGVRSAVFAPVKNLKYIIIDEEHETTYKQDSSPRYHARYAAIKRAELEGGKVIMGSATPSIESYYYGHTGIYKLFEIEARYNSIEMPQVEIVDMRREEQENFSSGLIYNIHQNLKKREQSLLFLNRKGYSTYIQCKACGHAEYCPHCSVALNYYRGENRVKCSYCGYEKTFEKKCSSCGSDKLNYSGQGTEKIEMQLKNLFKDGKIIRIDSESTKEKEAYEKFYRDFSNGEYDILVGTQVISKGLHFPNITFAGILNADSILNFPDFRAGEKTFQLIVQVAGRAGRGEKKGKVIIQSYNPDHYAVKYGAEGDYKGFYREEIEMRKELGYPPFGRLINIIISSETEENLMESAEKFYNEIYYDKIELYGPFKAPLYKINKRYRYQIFAKGKREEILKFKAKLESKLAELKDKNIRISVDVDPINLM